MPKRCVFGCATNDASLHSFPNPNKFPQQFNAWVEITGDFSMDTEDIFKKKKVCDVHFTDKNRNRNNRLNALAIPSLHLHGFHGQLPVRPPNETINQEVKGDTQYISELTGTQKPLHLFPNPEKDKQRFNEWLYSIGGDIIRLDNADIYKRRRVCHAHFEEKFCYRFKRLSDIAIPTLNLPGISHGVFCDRSLPMGIDACLPSTRESSSKGFSSGFQNVRKSNQVDKSSKA